MSGWLITLCSNAVQMLVLLATTALPAYTRARPGDWNGLQSYVDSLGSLADGFAQAEAWRLPDDPIPTYAFTPTRYPHPPRHGGRAPLAGCTPDVA
ncbi:MAG: hypothetical protein ACRDST_01610 [Pseudonocardiaceae bacterium]